VSEQDLVGAPEDQNIELLDARTFRKSELQIEFCEAFNHDEAKIPLDNVLDQLTGNDPATTDYVLAEMGSIRTLISVS